MQIWVPSLNVERGDRKESEKEPLSAGKLTNLFPQILESGRVSIFWKYCIQHHDAEVHRVRASNGRPPLNMNDGVAVSSS